MQDFLIRVSEHSDGINLILTRPDDQSPTAEATIETADLDSLLDRIQTLHSLPTHETSPELAAIGEAFANLLPFASLLATPNTTVRILCDSNLAHRLPWELLACPQPLGLTQNVRLIRLISEVKQDNPAERATLQLGLYKADQKSMAYDSLQAPNAEIQAIVNLFHRSRTVVPTVHNALQKPAPDLFHFSGHGDIRPSGGLLNFSDGPIYGEDLAQALKPNTRLAVLSACDTSGHQRAVGPCLAHAGIPAVIAMQCPISDEGAAHFARAFYLSLSLGNPVEDAIRDARFSIQGMGRDWLAPVLIRSAWSPPLSLVGKEEHNFPVMAGRFIGRQEELDKIGELTAKSRLVTLTGMGGIGKTTLGHQLGTATAGTMPDGAFLVECEAIRTRSDLVAATVDALSIQGMADPEKDLLGYLKNRQMLLVFDCFERITELSGFLTDLLKQCRDVNILVTSRILLGIKGETEFRVPPMSSKKRKQAASEAVELFVDTAVQFAPDFEATKSNRAQIQAIVDDLEGVPLALLLAASRLRHFTLDDLATRIRTNRLETLRRRGGPEDRHADLYRVIGDSLELLEESDRVLLGILTVFSGGFYLEDAQSVVGKNGDANSIAWLRDNSLLSANIEGGRMRYRMLDTIREYLQTSPYTKDLHEFQQRHAECFARKATAMAGIKGASKWAEIAHIYPVEAANFRAAVAFALATNNADLMRTFLLTLARVWLELGRPDEFDSVLPFVEDHFTQDAEIVMEIAGLEGELAKRETDYARAKRCWRKRADTCRAAENFEDYADTLVDMTDLGFMAEDPKLAKEVLHEFDQIDSELLSDVTRASGYVLHALFESQFGETDAKDYAVLAEELLKDRSPDQGHLYVQMRVARIYRQRSDLDKAMELTKRTVRQAIETSHLHSAGNALLQLAELFKATKRPDLESLAVFAGCRIPGEISTPLRREFRRLASEMPPERFALSNEKYARTDWTEIALTVAKQVIS